MAKRKVTSYKQKLVDALKIIPNPLEDKKHRIYIFFFNNRARSNQTRFEHISLTRHKLMKSDFKRIVERINESDLKKDVKKKDTFNLYIKRNNYGKEYIKISVELNFSKSNNAVVKSIFITENKK